MTKVVVITGSAIAQVGLESVLKTAPDLELGASLGQLPERMDLTAQYDADVLLLEGVELTADLMAQLAEAMAADPELGIVALMRRTDRKHLAQALEIGIRGFLPYSAAAAEIVAALRAVAAGLIVVHPDYRRDWLEDTVSNRFVDDETLMDRLTPREMEVLALLSQGLSNKAIATRLHLSEHTVKFHVGSIFEKLGASSRTEAVAIGLRQGLILL
ncbi:MAG: response regulator transcription factor [Thermosynechococcaceae cyanobacterium]